jgi:uncharacterized phage-associated protein
VSVRFQFNDLKTAQAAAYLLKLAGGRLNYMVLIKLLYLVDRQTLLSHGLPITGDRMFSMKNGPVLSQVLNFINEGTCLPKQSAWFDYVSPPSQYEVSLLKSDPETDELSRFELKLLQEVYAKYGTMEKWALVRLLHDILPEWKDPGSSSSPIEPEDILRAEARSDAEIREVHQGAEEMWFLKTVS